MALLVYFADKQGAGRSEFRTETHPEVGLVAGCVVALSLLGFWKALLALFRATTTREAVRPWHVVLGGVVSPARGGEAR